MSSTDDQSINYCDPHSTFFGFMGIAAAAVFCNLGAAYGMAKATVGICSMGVMRPDLAMRGIIPCVMASILGIYGLILGFMIQQGMGTLTEYPQAKAYAHLSCGLMVGLSSLAAGLAIGVVGDAGVRSFAHQPRLFVVMILILIFAEALALFGLILALVVSMVNVNNACVPYHN
ncbi:putative vacuolar ATP synthase 16 kDa proteolipid subunit [Gregarina niphandrodes]|uniref:V-type proton ATPase proteolipid subunit n=1 Tax=Gregarina niphandrodes TaxID=110365 RepID=A0A023B087_GRENI|nr:putative vacuolar ATP synthase 16 kDa proteolipid subunit [Gregarina niphandrodes]EZG44501.1 putative vacuolar ATP synthase 16 kDa proteolipid subunit [Gregarina niphandrodes]|eukprot:XP_011134171.1 putative vacuolar ATP synthase 16 kDa proteolipid subunit [Gregarina niphandrodes]